MQELLDKVDVKLLDHYIISETENFSFYENGLFVKLEGTPSSYF